MNNVKPILFAFLILSIILFCDCNKSNNNSNPNNFTWTFGGTTYTATLDTAYINRPIIPFYIIAITGTNFNTNFNQLVGFGLTSFNTGSFNIGSGGNTLQYIDVMAFDHTGVSGTLNITSNTNNLLSGNFSVIVNGPSGNVPLTGNFTNVSIR